MPHAETPNANSSSLPHEPAELAGTSILRDLVDIIQVSSLSANDRECIICHIEYGKWDRASLPERPMRLRACGHVFGRVCLERLVGSNEVYCNKCPICRAELFRRERPLTIPPQRATLQPGPPIQSNTAFQLISPSTPTGPVVVEELGRAMDRSNEVLNDALQREQEGWAQSSWRRSGIAPADSSFERLQRARQQVQTSSQRASTQTRAQDRPQEGTTLQFAPVADTAGYQPPFGSPAPRASFADIDAIIATLRTRVNTMADHPVRSPPHPPTTSTERLASTNANSIDGNDRSRILDMRARVRARNDSDASLSEAFHRLIVDIDAFCRMLESQQPRIERRS